MTDVCPNYLYSISFRECVDDVNLNLDYADLYVDLVNMKEFFFFYYPASPYDTQDEETFTDGIHTYHFLTDYSTEISPSSVYVVYKLSLIHIWVRVHRTGYVLRRSGLHALSIYLCLPGNIPAPVPR